MILLLGHLLVATPAPSVLLPDAARKLLPRIELELLDGTPMRADALAGHVIVISFWASWCAPCKQELALLDRLRARHAEAGLEVVAIATDGPETLAKVRSTVRAKRWKLRVALDKRGSVTQLLNPRGSVPYTLFVDRSGKIAMQHGGFTTGDEAKYERAVAELLAAP